MTGEKHLKNAAILGGGLRPVRTNNPSQYAGRQRQYFDPETRLFTQTVAKYSSDFVVARVQGLDGDLANWGTYRIRFADVVRPSSAIQRHFDDYKQILFESAGIEYLQPGIKIIAMGSTWLVTNPINASGASGSAVIRRCNAVWNHLDYYGNVVSEPIIVENERANASDSDAQESQLITKGYFNVICQYNNDTRQIDTNTRMILGSGAYRVTGYSDFETEFTGDYSSVRLLSFTVRYEEPNAAIDDMEHHVAGGKTFEWNIGINAPSKLIAGSSAQFEAYSTRNGNIVENTMDYPINYTWESSDESIATVDYYGEVTAIAEGEAVITATLAQNNDFTASWSILISEMENGVAFTSTTPEILNAYDAAVISAAYFENGEETDEPLTFTFSGANPLSFAAEVADDGKSVSIMCYGFSDNPLVVTAEHNGYSASAAIELEGI